MLTHHLLRQFRFKVKDKDSIGHLLVEKKRIQLIVFDPQREEILQLITEF